jgi:hypothetical protein
MRVCAEQALGADALHPETGRVDEVLASRRESTAMGDREERRRPQVHGNDARVRVECEVQHDVPTLVNHETHRGTREELECRHAQR